MRSKLAVSVLALSACAIGLLLGAPAATGQTPTPTPTRASSSTGVTVARERRVVLADGSVSPAHSGIAMTVSLLKQRGDRYRKIDTKHPKLTDSSTFSTKFRRAKGGFCAVRARFPGDDDHKPSKFTSIGFEC